MKEGEIKWCPTKEMMADFMTKPLRGVISGDCTIS